MAANGFGDRVVLETTSRVLTGEKDVLGYYSWGSNDSAITTRAFGLGFVPGAIAGMFVSTDGRTFKEPPADWTIGPWTDRAKFFAELAAVAGRRLDSRGRDRRGRPRGRAVPRRHDPARTSCSPPTSRASTWPSRSTSRCPTSAGRRSSWATRCARRSRARRCSRPTSTRGSTRPPSCRALFSARRLQGARRPGDQAGGGRGCCSAPRRGRRRATRPAPEGARGGDGDRPEAGGRAPDAGDGVRGGRRTTTRRSNATGRSWRSDPNDNAIALNNLAYALAVRKGQARRGARLRRARDDGGARQRPRSPTRWRGCSTCSAATAEAGKLLARRSSKPLPDNAEVRLHAAVVYAAVGMNRTPRRRNSARRCGSTRTGEERRSEDGAGGW